MIRMGEPDFSGYLQSLGAVLTAVALIASFIFTALTLVLLEMEDVTSVLAQATLLVLAIAFALALLSLSIVYIRMGVLRGRMLKARPPSTPGWRFYNLFILSSVLLMGISLVLMMFCRGLTYLGLLSVVIVVLTFTVHLIWLGYSPFRLKRGQDKQAQQ